MNEGKETSELKYQVPQQTCDSRYSRLILLISFFARHKGRDVSETGRLLKPIELDQMIAIVDRRGDSGLGKNGRRRICSYLISWSKYCTNDVSQIHGISVFFGSRIETLARKDLMILEYEHSLLKSPVHDFLSFREAYKALALENGKTGFLSQQPCRGEASQLRLSSGHFPRLKEFYRWKFSADILKAFEWPLHAPDSVGRVLHLGEGDDQLGDLGFGGESLNSLTNRLRRFMVLMYHPCSSGWLSRVQEEQARTNKLRG